MKNLLNKLETAIWWEDVAGVIHNDGSLPSGLSGDVTGLSGDLTGLRGNVTGLSGDVTYLRGKVTGLSGDVTGLRGDVTGLSGNVTDCELTPEDRANGVDISTLVGDGL